MTLYGIATVPVQKFSHIMLKNQFTVHSLGFRVRAGILVGRYVGFRVRARTLVGRYAGFRVRARILVGR